MAAVKLRDQMCIKAPLREILELWSDGGRAQRWHSPAGLRQRESTEMAPAGKKRKRKKAREKEKCLGREGGRKGRRKGGRKLAKAGQKESYDGALQPASC